MCFFNSIQGLKRFCKILFFQGTHSLLRQNGKLALAVHGSLPAMIDVDVACVRLHDSGVHIVAQHELQNGEGALLQFFILNGEHQFHAAVKVARENIALNHVEDRVRAVEGDLCKSEAMPCDLAVANIVADAIRMLAAPLTRHLAKGGLLICSGIIREREQDVLEAALAAGYAVADRLEKGEWVALALRNEAA